MARRDAGRERKRRGPWFVVFVIALVVLVGSLAALGVIAFSYLQGQWKYDEAAETAGFDPDDLEGEGPVAGASVDWDALLAVNPDTVAWVYLPNSSINYPVVQASDNEYYLTHDFDGDQGWLANYGAVFLDYRNNPDWSEQAYFFYGHHMNDGSMFSDLAGLASQERFDQCRTVYLLTPSGNFKLRTFSLVHCAADEELVQVVFGSEADMADYMQDKVNRSMVDPGAIPAAADIQKAFAFATCDNLYTDGRYVLYAYVEGASAEGLAGELGIEMSGGSASGFINDLRMGL